MLPKVSLIVALVARRIPATVDRGELYQAGSLALVEAAGRFDPRRGVKFMSYAESRIRGAMLDSLRRLRWLRSRHEETVVGLDAEAYAIRDAHDDPERTLQLKERRRQVRDAIDGRWLTWKQRRVLQLYYQDELTMKQIGERMGLLIARKGCSAVSQMHSAAIRRLRVHFQKADAA